MYRFPNPDNLPKGDDQTPIYGGSIGSNRIFEEFRKSADTPTSPRWDLYLINIYTLARNAYGKGMAVSGLETMVDADADLFMTFIGAYTQFRRPTPSIVVFYAPDYGAIPATLMRKSTGQRSELDALYAALRAKMPQTLTDISEDVNVRKYIMVAGSRAIPYKDLIGALRVIYKNGSLGSMRRAVMISHCPIDLHLVTYIPTLMLMESYTGTVLEAAEFGRKLTKSVAVPFNTVTHRVFGDDVTLIPLIRGPDRSRLIELAQKNHWILRTESEITKDVITAFPPLRREDLMALRL